MTKTGELKVVVVEDTEMIVDLVSRVLELEPGVVMSYGGSDAGALMVESAWQGVDVALVDLRLPGVPGDHLLDWLAQHAPHVRRLAMSACGPLRMDEAASAERRLLKPFLAVELPAALRSEPITAPTRV